MGLYPLIHTLTTCPFVPALVAATLTSRSFRAPCRKPDVNRLVDMITSFVPLPVMANEMLFCAADGFNPPPKMAQKFSVTVLVNAAPLPFMSALKLMLGVVPSRSDHSSMSPMPDEFVTMLGMINPFVPPLEMTPVKGLV